MPVYALLIEYDGADYCGWQRQKDHPTVQASLEEALRTYLRSDDLRITGAGRTDTGVHARGQVAHFEFPAIPEDMWLRFVRALNGLLPRSIALHCAVRTADDFHARYDARRRIYHYHLSTIPLALERSHRLYVIPSLDFERMNDACKVLTGTHDFGAFCRTRSETQNRVCSVFNAQWIPEQIPGYWKFTIEADRFLHGMVRSLVGTLLEIGQMQRSVPDLEVALETRDRSMAGPTAPAHALILDHVVYPMTVFNH